jgi:homogentisate 1,2-dioxygenase
VIDRMQLGEVPPKHHVVSRAPGGALLWEECLTRHGFDGPYTIAHHRNRPHEQISAPEIHHGWNAPPATTPPPLRKRHYRTQDLPDSGLPSIDARTPLLWNDDLVLSLVTPGAPDPVYFSNGDGDDLYFVAEGSGVLRTVLGDVRFGPEDYVFVPKGVVHRFLPDAGPHCCGGMDRLLYRRQPRPPTRWVSKREEDVAGGQRRGSRQQEVLDVVKFEHPRGPHGHCI